MRRPLIAALLLAGAPARAQEPAPAMPAIASLKDHAATRDAWLAKQLDTLLPRLMRAHGIDMWVLVAREYAEDPVLATMLDARSFHARRRTILVLFDPGGDKPIERLTVSRYGLGGLFAPAWDPAAEPQWATVAKLIAARDPRRIALNISADSAFADGLTASQHDALVAALPPALRQRIVPAGGLAIDWLQTRIPEERAAYPGIVRIAHGVIAEAFSSQVIRPGETRAGDVVWWMREKVRALGLSVWFQPSVSIFRQGAAELSGDEVILPGDLLWTDFGIMHLGLATDTQHLGYVLKPGEREAPAGLRAGLADANAAQDGLVAAFRTGATGNDLLLVARKAAAARGIDASIYSHPIGHHGHGAGPAIGFWDDQAPGPRGAGPVRADTFWSIELAATRAVPEWGGQRVPFRLEEDMIFDGREVIWADGRQNRFHLIGRD
ncbi:M24 family metallopeptidase [Sphingomonas sp. 1P06PA]|uniref:M24 family metallopeptidase n=1 Tax=Sphingomonas sp. 1P06PA TaxID=554121 RepID=UPI0039A671C8